jgi:hypothetical protein
VRNQAVAACQAALPTAGTSPTITWAQASLASAHTGERTLVHSPTPPPWPEARPSQQVGGMIVGQLT